jgi:predicted nucleic acid-binding protein
VVWPTAVDCERAQVDFTTFYLSHSLGLLDSLIAACAIGRGASLLTFNDKHYRMVSGLVIEQPYTR